MKKNLWIIIIVVLPITNYAQGILDSLAPPIDADSIEVLFDQLNPSLSIKPNKYRYDQYLKDSANLARLHDSIAKKWIFDDSLPTPKNTELLFNNHLNRELKKNNPRPIAFTLLFFIILVGFVIKSMLYSSKMIFEYNARIRSLVYKEWFESQLAVINFYNVFSKFISVCLHALFISYLLLRVNWVIVSTINLIVPAILLGIFSLLILKYFIGWFLGSIFQNISLVKHHFTHNQLSDNFLFIPLLFCFALSYFLNGSIDVDWIMVVGSFLIVLNRLVSIIIFGGLSLLNRDNKKFYVIFYLCTLEIIPILVLFKFMAVAYI